MIPVCFQTTINVQWLLPYCFRAGLLILLLSGSEMEKFGKNTVGTIDSLFGGMEGYMDDINKVSIYYIIDINPLMIDVIDDKPEGFIMYKY